MTHVGTEPKLFPGLEEHLKILRETEMRIQSLEDQLDAARKEYSSIHRHIEDLRASRAPIRRVPRELLTMVFENYREDQQSRNTNLLLVCKLWYDIVTNTPSLWSNIILKLTHVETISVVWRYADTCIRRSLQHRLDIWINATEFGPVEYRAADLDENLSLLNHDGIPTYCYDEDFRFNTIWDSIGDPDTRAHEYGIYIALGLLRGEDDEHISRWRSLRIDFYCRLPRDVVSKIVQGLGNGPYNLEILDIRAPKRYSAVVLEIIPFITTVSRLVLGAPASFYFERPYNAQHLVILNAISISAFEMWGSSCFQNIRSLEIQDDDWYRLEALQSNTITLPYLKYLALARSSSINAFELPRLTHLFVRHAFITADHPSPILSLVTDFRYPWYTLHLSIRLKAMVLMMPRLKRLHLGGGRNCSYADLASALEEVRGEVDTSATCVDDPNGNEWPVKLEIP